MLKPAIELIGRMIDLEIDAKKLMELKTEYYVRRVFKDHVSYLHPPPGSPSSLTNKHPLPRHYENHFYYWKTTFERIKEIAMNLITHRIVNRIVSALADVIKTKTYKNATLEQTKIV